MHEVICGYCGDAFSREKDPKGQKVYCSKSCSNRGVPRRKPQGQCATCRNPIAAERKYCDACYETFLATRPKQSDTERKAKLSILVMNRIRKLKMMGVELLGSQCIVCGYSKCIAALEFHHVDPTTKSFTLSGKSISWEKFKAEVLKCVLLCANCHREVENGVTVLPSEVVDRDRIELSSIG